MNYHSTAFVDLESAVNLLESSISEGQPDLRLRMHRTISALYQVSSAIQLHGPELNDAIVLPVLEKARALHRKSPFVKRLQDWPRGYPGDFETIEMICNARPELAQEDPAYFIEWYAMNSAIAQQHRNKIAFQSSLITDVLARPQPGTIVSIGCGGARDFAFLRLASHQHLAVLIDQDNDALALAASRVEPFLSCQLINDDAVRGLRAAPADADLFLFGGLFDYLSDRVIKVLLQIAVQKAKPQAVIAFTNITQENLFDSYIETMANWNLIKRDSGQMLALTEPLRDSGFVIELERDATGLTWLLTARRRVA